jgi:hypothetical protein
MAAAEKPILTANVARSEPMARLSLDSRIGSRCDLRAKRR